MITARTVAGKAVSPRSISGEAVPAEAIRAETGEVRSIAPRVPAFGGDIAPAAARSAAAPGVVLPVPPDDAEKRSYIRHGAWILVICALVSLPLVVYSQLFLMADYHWYLFCAPFVLLGAIFLALPLVTDGIGKSFDEDAHNRLASAWRPDHYPAVDVFLPVCGEPLPVLRNTWEHVTRMVRHYKGTVVPYVLDDSASPEIRAMAQEFGFVYATRPNRGWYKKSGNLWFGFHISGGEYILLLDADFAPRHDLLDETLPYMHADPGLGIVQTPQFFHVVDDQTWVERGAGAVQELFYRSIQTMRSPKGGAICVGSCAVYRRAALAENGGMTIAEHSEDVLTGFDLNTLGWRLRYIPLALSTGNCPDDVVAFLNQQYRWCSGTVGLLFTRRFWRASLPLRTRMCYMAGLVYYLYTAVFTFAVPLLTISLLAFEPHILILRNMAFMLPAMVYAATVFPTWHHAPYRLEAWAVKLIAGWAHFFAYWDAVRGKPLGWNPTGSDRRKQDGGRRFWTCFVVWTLGSSLFWTGLALWRMMTMDPVNFAVLLGLGVFEAMVAARVLIQPANSAS
ncbi:MAG TPA: glycosyltransferase family 2 protein [Trebonia sp.]|jgi:cellulose synthase (UDP-forming)|nr:glycosyltransferase family 2 protein [Trebonia sp.]